MGLCCSHENLEYFFGNQRIYQCQASLQWPYSDLGPTPNFMSFHCFLLVMDNSTAVTNSGGFFIFKVRAEILPQDQRHFRWSNSILLREASY